MRQLDIGEVARRSGVPASTLRYYEEKGLIASSGRHGLRRLGLSPPVLRARFGAAGAGDPLPQ
ncbi:MerR family DNA-binding transcriptional regulator, partial [Pseudomonas aeruginosa]|uniref:MerR family DNA-binding transcriptional regulator n=1 Tax=Pseudomonas aeruginosa TaxID=287 RepID=UPI0021AB3361